jgi:hypothetical protein
MLSVRISERLRAKLEREAERRGVGLSALVRWKLDA